MPPRVVLDGLDKAVVACHNLQPPPEAWMALGVLLDVVMTIRMCCIEPEELTHVQKMQAQR